VCAYKSTMAPSRYRSTFCVRGFFVWDDVYCTVSTINLEFDFFFWPSRGFLFGGVVHHEGGCEAAGMDGVFDGM